jgi:hypothetical protein
LRNISSGGLPYNPASGIIRLLRRFTGVNTAANKLEGKKCLLRQKIVFGLRDFVSSPGR